MRVRVVLTTAALVAASFWALHAQAPAGRGRGNPAPSLPPPPLADGTVNFGRVAGEKGIWNVPYITNRGMRLVDDEGKPLAAQPEGRGARGEGRGGRAGGAEGRAGLGGPLGGREGTAGGGGRGGAKSE